MLNPSPLQISPYIQRKRKKEMPGDEARGRVCLAFSMAMSMGDDGSHLERQLNKVTGHAVAMEKWTN